MWFVRVCDCYLDKDLGEPNLPVVTISSEHPRTDLLGSTLEVTYLSHCQSGNKHSVTLHKLVEGVTDGVTSTTDSDQSD